MYVSILNHFVRVVSSEHNLDIVLKMKSEE